MEVKTVAGKSKYSKEMSSPMDLYTFFPLCELIGIFSSMCRFLTLFLHSMALHSEKLSNDQMGNVKNALSWRSRLPLLVSIDQITNLLIVQFSFTLAIKHKSIPMFLRAIPPQSDDCKTSWWLKFLPIFQMACFLFWKHCHQWIC